MSKIEQQLAGLKAAFDAVTAAIREEQPELWAEALDLFQEDDAATRFLIEPNRGLGGKSPLEYAAQDRQAVLSLIGRIKYSIY
jgi:uncharacterized protein (DUF2384 family)